jgi:purine-binding chemotaxis protein CheW
MKPLSLKIPPAAQKGIKTMPSSAADNEPAMVTEPDRVQTQERQLVVFCLSDGYYGVDISTVREILRLQDITRVPNTPAFVEGLTNLRGRVLPVIDLRKRFGLPAVRDTTNNRIAIVDIAGQDIGVIVDAVTEVLRIPIDCVEPPSSIETTISSEYLLGIAKLPSRLIVLLDLETALSEKEKGELSELAGGS